ncbi:hypothetical protein BEP19_08105 [Ammoniphilus oxalaticus]|uniref:Uncharacterized protein n=1 Tax=Ammoniphilus oxalaticus TaxID=66863 RepID=A0A419SKB7_9BACL|nr:hypothetical protein [Ammoniphilus oxalaticus]RKD24348.1 hypothetical protein BEP19_08105 [Ammoniphilus oxalaticus]
MAILVICSILLFRLALVEGIYHPIFFYPIVILIIGAAVYRVIREEEFELRFYERWKKAREQGYWTNVIREGVKSFVKLGCLVGFGQFFGNGLSPRVIVSSISGLALVFIILFLGALSYGIGLISWHENNKRFDRIEDRISNSV